MVTTDLPTKYRQRAEAIERYSPAAAEAFREAAELAEAALDAEANEVLTPQEIEELGRCTAETVRRAVRDGSVESVGTPGKILIRRGDLDQLPKGRTRRSGGKRQESSSFGKVALRVAETANRRRKG